MNIYHRYPGFVAFIFKTKLLFPLLGYQQTIGQSSLSEAFQIIQHEAPSSHLRAVIRWECIQIHIQYDEKESLLLSQHNDQEGWKLASSKAGGLIPTLRTNPIVPIHQLREEEYEMLIEYARRSIDPNDRTKSCVVQIVSSPHHPISPSLWTENFNALRPASMSPRLITQDQFFYSFGLKILPNEIKEHLYAPESSPFQIAENFLTTFNGHLGVSDYKESQRFLAGRYVTGLFAKSLHKASA